MFTGKQFGVLGVIFGANMILSLLTGTIAASVGPRGPEGATGPEGPQGTNGEVGPAGENGREVEFQTSEGVLQWRYTGETEWNTLDLELGGGGGGSTNVTSAEFTDWIFSPSLVAPTYTYDPTEITDASAYQTNLVTQGFTPITTAEELANISNDLGGRYVLMNDLNLADYDTSSQPYMVSGTFTGIFDGAGKTISNFAVAYDSSIDQAGLFYEMTNATVRQLNLVDFSFETSSGYIDQVGALVGYVGNNNSDASYFEMVTAQNITFKATDYLQRVGGLVGEIDSSVFFKGVTSSATVEFDSWGESIGGTFGEFSGAEIEVINAETTLTLGPNLNEENTEYIQEVGGLGGYISNGSSIILANIVTEFTGIASAQVGGLIGYMNSSSKAILSNIDAQIDLIGNGNGSTESFGGLVGSVDDESYVLIDGSSVEGTIVGYDNVGGVIGFLNYSSSVKIQNVYVETMLAGYEYIGGFVGYVDSNSIRLFVSDSEFNGSFTTFNQPNNDYLQNSYIGGVVGYIDDSDTNILDEKNQVLIDNTSVNAIFDFQIIETDEVGYLSFNFQYHGGIVGYVDYYNYVRVTNSEVSVSSTYSVTGHENFESLNVSLYSLGGAFGYVSEDSNIQVLGCSIETSMDVTMDDINATSTNTNSVQFSLSEVGGLVGDLEDSSLVAVATEVFLDVESNYGAINAPTFDLYYYVSNFGGLVGYSDGYRPILTDDVSVGVTFDFGYEPTGSAGPDQYITVTMYSIATMFGTCENGALMLNTSVFNLGITFPSTPGASDSVSSQISFLTTTGIVGEPNPFVMFL